ncbi:MAG: glycosyltransferase family 2 protein [Bacteroidetes bacterium]|nr:glycosyltransferase family 2 protein [Bacteroidota bacterium]MBP6401488.1 glycosyltransferase family 2 protein [Bacteroidia bacterium]MBP6649108.1 glycosyltransferase family 2 protein [Bacteroidia bacterium]
MKVTGFTFIRNAIRFDYPIVEAITSILPLCDEFIVVVGNSEDSTFDLIKNINSVKIKIINSTWDDSLREGGRVLAAETNKALDAISDDTNWCFYIQGDEVMHEQYIDSVRAAMLEWENEKQVEGLLFDYLHFYGSYDFVADSTKWYRKEVRIIRKDSAIRSFRDAQGFQKNGRPLRVKKSGGSIYHYGWVKPPSKQQEKQQYFHSLWHSDEWMSKNIPKNPEFDYSKVDSVSHFSGTHPFVMQERIRKINWKFDFDPTVKKLSFKSRFKHSLENLTGWRIGEYKNYRLI